MADQTEPVTRLWGPIPEDRRPFTVWTDFWRVSTPWPADFEDQRYREDPHYKRYTIMTLGFTILLIVPALIAASYAMMSRAFPCRHPLLNAIGAGTVTNCFGIYTAGFVRLLLKQDWIGRRAVYFERWMIIVGLYLGIAIGAGFSSKLLFMPSCPGFEYGLVKQGSI